MILATAGTGENIKLQKKNLLLHGLDSILTPSRPPPKVENRYGLVVSNMAKRTVPEFT